MDSAALKTVLDDHTKWVRSYHVDGKRADLRGADLRGADLGGADLRGADLGGISTDSATKIDQRWLLRTQIVPQSGSFRAFKKVYDDTTGMSLVAVLEIPEEADRVGGTVGRKCRASEAIVLGFLSASDKTQPAEEVVIARSAHDSSFKYRTGETVTPSNGFDGSPLVECAPGIHFFLTYEEAAEY